MSWLNCCFLAVIQKRPAVPGTMAYLAQNDPASSRVTRKSKGPKCGQCEERPAAVVSQIVRNFPPLRPCSSQFISPSLCSSDLSRMWGRLLHQVLRGFSLEGRSQKASDYSYFGNECLMSVSLRFSISHVSNITYRTSPTDLDAAQCDQRSPLGQWRACC